MSFYVEESLKYLVDLMLFKIQGLLIVYVMQRKKNYIVDSEIKEGLYVIFFDVVFLFNLYNLFFYIFIVEVVENMILGEGKFKILVD